MNSLRLPFVVTVVGSAIACGGTAVIDGDAGQGGATGSGASGSGATGSGASGSGASGSGASGPGGGVSIQCPSERPNPYLECAEPAGQRCSYEVKCQSGVVELEFECANGFWALAPTECRAPYDSCPGTEYYCDGQWWEPVGSNPPSPCPESAPPEGTPCYPGGMGGDWEHCGYLCAPEPSAWTVASCLPDATGQTTWQYDGACGG
jgi:hypothetical protein